MNAQLIAGTIDGAIDLGLAGFFLFGFKFLSARIPFLQGKRWVSFVAAAFLGLNGLASIYGGYRRSRAEVLPTARQAASQFAASSVLAESDLTYRSPDKFRIMVPAGYKYVAQGMSGGISFMAAGPGNATFLVAKTRAATPIETTFRDICASLRRMNPTYTCNPPAAIKAGDVNGLRTDLQVVKPSGPGRAVVAVFQKGEDMYQVTLSCPAGSFDGQRAEFDRILASFSLEP